MTLTLNETIGPDPVRPVAENSGLAASAGNNAAVVATPRAIPARWTALSSVLVVGGLIALASAEPAPWPSGQALHSVPLPAHQGPPIRVYLDAGHGAPDNPGNRGAYGQLEEGFTLALAREVATWLEAQGGFETRISRDPGERVDYHHRVEEAEAWGAHVFVSLHSDVRGVGEPWTPRAGGPACSRSHDAPGFSVLWSDASVAAHQSHKLGQALSAQMRLTGLPAYDGRHYGNVYDADPQSPGLFVDRHVPGERIFVLWRPKIPAVLIETHHALDDREVRRWGMPETQRAFASALGAALRDTLPVQRQARRP